MSIDTFFEKYPENIIGFRVNNEIKIIDFWADNDWDVFNFNKDENTNFEIKLAKEDIKNNRSYYLIFSNQIPFNELYTELCKVIEYNLDRIKKDMLLQAKMNELKELFESHSYEELQKLELTAPTLINQPLEDLSEKINSVATGAKVEDVN
jgi:hypothetical protein